MEDQSEVAILSAMDAKIKNELSMKKIWQRLNGKLHKDYEFADFDAAFGFMKKASFEIEKMNHHPEWFNVYNKVTVDLVTHDAGGITENDTKLAGILNELAGM